MTISQSPATVSIPRPLTSLIGRERELDQLYELLRSDVSLVTITGFGGIGKTRLALQAALELEPVFEAGALFVPLASVTRGESMPLAIANSAGLEDAVDTISMLAESLGSASRLLVLDNLEQIPDAAEIVLNLLTALPHLTILATSRAPLELAGEYLLLLEPFDVDVGSGKSPDEMHQFPAVQLFLERATAVSPFMPIDDEAVMLVAQICQMLDGIPLAIELAAARLTIFSLPELRDQLHRQLPVLSGRRVDMPDRQKTMRNAIAWTYDLLEPAERRLFCWLSVYERDFSIGSIQHVAQMLELTEEPLDLVQFLVSRNLVRPGRHESETPRYQILQMLREFGHEQLVATNEDQIARRSHAMDMVELAERAEPHLITHDAVYWMHVLDDDLPNILAATAWSLEREHHHIVLRIIGAIWRYIDTRGHISLFHLHVKEVEIDPEHPALAAKALVGIGYLYEEIRHLDESGQAFTTALKYAQAANEGVLQVRATTGLGTLEFHRSDFVAAREHFQRARELALAVGDARGQLTANSLLATVGTHLGDLDEAIRLNQENIDVMEHTADPHSIALCYSNLGLCYSFQHKYELAKNAFLRSAAIHRDSDDKQGLGYALANLGSLSLVLEEHEKGRAYTDEAIAIARETGMVYVEASLLSNMVGIELMEGKYAKAAQTLARSTRMMRSAGGDRDLAHNASVLMDVCLAMQLLPEAAELLGATLALREKLQVPPPMGRDTAENRALATLRSARNSDVTAAMDRGTALESDQLFHRILDIVDQIIATSSPLGHPEPEPVSQNPNYRLTPREIEVLGMIAAGHSNAEIADHLFVSLRTVTTHVTNILGKLEVNNRSRAVAIALQEGLV